MANETPVTPTATPAAPAPQPDEGLLHELATSAGLDPEAIVATAKAIRQHPWQVAKEVGSAQAGEFVDAGHHLRDTALSALNGVASAITNPEAKATAIARLKSPGLINKIQGAEEYATAAVPLVGGNYVKAEEQAGRGNIAGSIGTTLGTTLPLVTDTEGAEGIKAHLAETGKTFVDSAKEGLQRAAVATAPEGSAEAGFAKIPGSKKVRGATPKSIESPIAVPEKNQGSESQVLKNGGWLLPEGQNYVHQKGMDLRDLTHTETHGESARAMGFGKSGSDPLNARLDALNQGAVRATTDIKGQTTLEVFGITDKNKSRLMDALAVAPTNKPVYLAWGMGNPHLDSPKEFSNPEEAIDWVDRQTPQSAQPDKLAAVPGAKFVGKTPEPPAPAEPPAPPVSVPEEESEYTPQQKAFANQAHTKYPLAGPSVDGRTVREHVPNFDSINATLGVYPGAYDVLEGVREIPMSEFSDPGAKSARVTGLANEIHESKELNPLIVGMDKDGPYIIEGAHRFDALRKLGAKSFPAVVAVDLTDEGIGKATASAPAPSAEYHPDLQKVIDLPGVKVHTDPKQVTEAAHFVTPDGKFVRLPAGMDHPDAIIAAGAKHENEGLSQQPFTVPPFLNDTGTIRIRPTQDANGTTLHVSVPVAGVSSKQVEALKQAVGQGLKSQGHLMLETADNPRDIKTEYKDFARSSDVEPMLRTIGAHPDQTGTLPKEVTPIQLKKVDKSEASEAGYVYHATSEDRAHDIAQDGLKTHKPNAFTDQTTWPDGATEKRNYFTKTAEHTWQFAPEDGKPVLIRTKPSANFKTESTGDVYTKKVIKPEAIEILGEDNNWHPITSLKRPAK